MIPTWWKVIWREKKILKFTMMGSRWNKWLSLSTAIKKCMMRIWKKITHKPNANTAWCPNLKDNKNFYALRANAPDHAEWFISTVWSSGISKRSGKFREKVASNIISKSFSARCANNSIHSISRNTKKCMKFYPSSNPKVITSLWKPWVQWKDTLLSFKI